MHARPDRATRSAVALDRWEPRIDVVDIDFDTSRGRARQARHRDHLLRCGRPATCATSSIPSTSSPRGPNEHPADRARRPALPGPRQRGPAARRPGLPGVDRAQRLGSGHHADRAVRVDDRDARLPAQPRAGQAPPLAARAARDPGRRAGRRHDRAALPARRPGRRAGRDPGGDDRGGHDPHRQRRVDRVPDELRLHHPAGASDGLRRRARRRTQERRRRGRRGAAEGRRPARLRAAAEGRQRALPRLRHLARAAAPARRRRVLAGARRRRRPRGSAAALRGLATSPRRRAGARRRCSTTSPAASTTAPARSSCSCRRATRR